METVLIIFGTIVFAIVAFLCWLNWPVVYRGVKMSPGEAFEREFGLQRRQDELWRELTHPREAAARYARKPQAKIDEGMIDITPC